MSHSSHHPSLVRRCVLMALGLILAGLGVALTTRAGLGTSPISSVPYVLTWVLRPLTFGMTTFLLSIVFLLGEVVILRRKFAAVQYCQLLVTLIFSAAIDLGMWVTAFFQPHLYGLRVLYVVLGSAVMALGIALQVHANVLLNPGEGFVRALCYATHLRFAVLKIFFDFSLMMIAICIALVAIHHLEGIREGTVLAAFAVGFFLRFFLPWTRPLKKLTYPRRIHARVP